MATYIGTKYGDDAAQEWTSGVQTVIPDPVHSPFILTRHAERVKATKDWLTLKLTSLRDERGDIVLEITVNPNSHTLKKKLREIDDDIAKTEIELKDEVEMKLTDDEKTAHSNAWRTHRVLVDLKR